MTGRVLWIIFCRAWADAAVLLTQEQIDAHNAEHGFDPFRPLTADGPVPGTPALNAAYREAVDRIASEEGK